MKPESQTTCRILAENEVLLPHSQLAQTREATGSGSAQTTGRKTCCTISVSRLVMVICPGRKQSMIDPVTGRVSTLMTPLIFFRRSRIQTASFSRRCRL